MSQGYQAAFPLEGLKQINAECDPVNTFHGSQAAFPLEGLKQGIGTSNGHFPDTATRPRSRLGA